MEMPEPIDGATDLLRRLPPSKVKENINKIIELRPDIQEDLLASVDQPLIVEICQETKKEFLQCDYNRDGTSFRSPWSNEYQPMQDGYKPTPELRQLEISANEAFQVYRDLYFGSGISSCYFWEVDQGFAAAILIKKVNSEGNFSCVSWDSMHIFQVQSGKNEANYKVTSTIMLTLTGEETEKKPFLDLCGNLTRQAEMDFSVTDPTHHVQNIGKMVEEMENKLRTAVNEIYFAKTRDILNELRSLNDLEVSQKQHSLQAQLIGNLRRKE